MNIRLSFCIPCYNFAEFLPTTLDSIISQAGQDVEIVLVDGGSTDETDDIVADYQKRFDRLVYFKREQRCGVDRDILKSVELASGEYCWLFSADDVLPHGAMDRIRPMIDGQSNVVLMNFTICDFKMNPLAPHQIIGHHNGPRLYDWADPKQRAEYLETALTSTAFFSFISSIVVKREDWLAADPCEQFVGSCWIIAAKILSMSKHRLVVRYIPEAVFLKRGDNDSFLSMGIAKRLRLAMEGFPSIAKAVFGSNTPEHEAFKRVVRNELPFGSLLTLKTKAQGNRQATRELCATAKELWAKTSREHAQVLLLRVMPVSTIRWAKQFAQRHPRFRRWVKEIKHKEMKCVHVETSADVS